jgi:hypothetical protein
VYTAYRVAAHRGVKFTFSTIDQRGVSRTLYSLDRSFRRPLTGPAALNRLRERGMKLDIGLDDDVYSTMVALTLLPKGLDPIAYLAEVVQNCRSGNRFRFFFESNGFPHDTDSTGLAVAGLIDQGLISPSELLAITRELLLAAAPFDRQRSDSIPALKRGVLTMYWEDGREPGVRPRGYKHDAVACAHALYPLLHARRLGLVDSAGVIDATMSYIADHLVSGRYLEGSRYFLHPESFLYAVSRLWCFSECRVRLAESLPSAVSRIEQPEGGSALNLAQQIIAVDNLGLEDGQHERRGLLAAQQATDGSWPPCAYYRPSQYPIYYGSPVMTTLFAVRALCPSGL